MWKRLFDLAASGVGLLLLSPVFLLIALLIKVDSSGPVFFRQERVGRYGKTFKIHKFRTMMVNAEAYGMQITVGTDSRVTKVGRFLRRYKLDELPQLIDVFYGEMSIVGPRPEVPRYVMHYPDNIRDIVLSVKPGITDRASIEFRNESELLEKSGNPQETYVNEIIPIKLGYYQEYVRNRTFFGDILIIADTLKAIFR